MFAFGLNVLHQLSWTKNLTRFNHIEEEVPLTAAVRIDFYPSIHGGGKDVDLMTCHSCIINCVKLWGRRTRMWRWRHVSHGDLEVVFGGEETFSFMFVSSFFQGVLTSMLLMHCFLLLTVLMDTHTHTNLAVVVIAVKLVCNTRAQSANDFSWLSLNHFLFTAQEETHTHTLTHTFILSTPDLYWPCLRMIYEANLAAGVWDLCVYIFHHGFIGLVINLYLNLHFD